MTRTGDQEIGVISGRVSMYVLMAPQMAHLNSRTIGFHSQRSSKDGNHLMYKIYSIIKITFNNSQATTAE